MQEDLQTQEVQGTAGGGAVTVTLSGSMDVKAVKIKPEAVDPDDVETLEDLVMAAYTDAKSKVDALTQAQMGNATGGMKIPGFNM